MEEVFTSGLFDPCPGRTCLDGWEGRERGVMSYSVEAYLLSGMKSVADSFNASESSLEWKALYKLMVGQYHNAFGYNCRPLATLQSYFVDLYSVIKNGIRGILLVTGTPKFPAKYFNGNDELEDYAAALESHLSSKKGLPVEQ